MTNDLTDARNRLVSPRRLRQVAALLNMPHSYEIATHDDAPRSTQQAALYADISQWAGLSALAAEQLGGRAAPQPVGQFVYLVEYTDQYAKGWNPAPSEHFQGIILADTAERVTRTVLARYISHLAEYRDDYQLWLVDSLSLRASVWRVNSAEAHHHCHPNCLFSWHTMKDTGIPPHAVEIRTPIQIRRCMDHHLARASKGHQAWMEV